MSQVTYFVALPFRYVDGEMVAGEPQECRDAFKARSVAAVLASNADNCGAVAFSRTGDPALWEFDDAVIIVRLGEVDDALMGPAASIGAALGASCPSSTPQAYGRSAIGVELLATKAATISAVIPVIDSQASLKPKQQFFEAHREDRRAARADSLSIK